MTFYLSGIRIENDSEAFIRFAFNRSSIG